MTIRKVYSLVKSSICKAATVLSRSLARADKYKDRRRYSLSSRELVSDLCDIILTIHSLTSIYEEYHDFEELRCDLHEDRFRILARLEDGRKVVIDEFDLNIIDISDIIAEEIIRRNFSSKIYGKLLKAIWYLKVVLRSVNATIYIRAYQLGEEGRELEENYWYVEALANIVLELLIRAEVTSALIMLRTLTEEIVKLVTRFNDLEICSFKQNLDTLTAANIIEESAARQLRKTYNELSAIIHGSRSRLGGGETIGTIGLAFDLNVAHNNAEFLNKDLAKTINTLTRLFGKGIK